MYYIEKNNKIILFAEDRQTIENGFIVMPQYKDLPINYTNKTIVEYKGEYVFEEDITEQLYGDRRTKFNKEFFNTSLGYVRRKFTNKNGEVKDFLSDAFPALLLAFKEGVIGEIFVYDKPPFTEDVEDWTQYQHKVAITPQFIQECFNQSNVDFFG